MARSRWLLLIYKVPSEPSSARVAVWRKLKAYGAVSLQQSVWVLPDDASHQEFFTKVCEDVVSAGGHGYILHTDLDSASPPIEKQFVAERNHEYREFVERCEMLLSEIQRERDAQKFSFAELTELEEDMARMTKWLEQIRSRDYYLADQGHVAMSAFEKCREALQAFAQDVYATEGIHGGDAG